MVKINLLTAAGYHKCSGNSCNYAAPPGYKTCQRCRDRNYRNPNRERNATKYEASHADRHRAKYRRRMNMLERYKQLVGCQRCGFNGHPAALVFHHDCGVKNHPPSQMTAAKPIRLYEELRLCSVLCANCHNILHAEEKKKEKTHSK